MSALLFAIAALILASNYAAHAARDLPYTCEQVRQAVRYLGSLEAAERYAASQGVQINARQRAQARACLG